VLGREEEDDAKRLEEGGAQHIFARKRNRYIDACKIHA
jgi:hypothetical protein